VGRTGIIAPRAVLEPVEIDGATITYATLLLLGLRALSVAGISNCAAQRPIDERLSSATGVAQDRR